MLLGTPKRLIGLADVEEGPVLGTRPIERLRLIVVRHGPTLAAGADSLRPVGLSSLQPGSLEPKILLINPVGKGLVRHSGAVSNSAIIITGSFTLGGVVLASAIDAARRRHDERMREREAREREILDVVTASQHLLDAVLQFRSITMFRRGITTGLGTGVEFGSRYMTEEPSIWRPSLPQ